jgi:hypothetical protein
LQSGGTVELHATDPYTLLVAIGEKYQKSVTLPLPLNHDGAKVRIARKSL